MAEYHRATSFQPLTPPSPAGTAAEKKSHRSAPALGSIDGDLPRPRAHFIPASAGEDLTEGTLIFDGRPYGVSREDDDDAAAQNGDENGGSSVEALQNGGDGDGDDGRAGGDVGEAARRAGHVQVRVLQRRGRLAVVLVDAGNLERPLLASLS